MHTKKVLQGAVMLAGAASGASAVVALARPAALSRSAPPEDDFYVRMYAARALPLAVATIDAATSPRDRTVLVLSAAVQAIDVGIGISRRNLPMTLSPMVAVAALSGLATMTGRSADR